MVRLSVTVRPPDWRCPDTAKLKRELSKKYPVLRIQVVGKNPPDPNGSIHLFIAVYLVKEVFGPTLRQMVKDAYVKKQMSEKNANKLALPPAFIYNGHDGAKGKKRSATKRKDKRKSGRLPGA